ncbi:MAG: FAD-binding oxidoreductase [Candidatus Zambryskibacteria bacterium]|nr:FAD-binding oxidoreductase [Candidatus Zambryskibacteria bacterium]
MKIAVVGAGIFGVTTAVKLAQAGYKVNLYEKNSDILSAASGINQYRLHRGYHYPRSKSTALSSKYAEDSFRGEYGEAVIKDNEHYYAVAKEDSKITGEEFLNFCKECELEHQEVELDEHLNPEHISLIIKGVESLIDPLKLRELSYKKIKESGVNLLLNKLFLPKHIDEYDWVVNCTYANSNFILEKYPEAQRDYQFEVCEKPLLSLPEKYRNKSIVVLDGPFFCIDPYSDTGLHVMGNVVHAIHATNIGPFPIVPEEIKLLLNKGVIKNPSVTNIKYFLKVAQKFMPDFKNAEHFGSMYTVRTVLPNVEKTDERPTLVSKAGDKVVNVFSGKIGNCVEAAHEVVKMIKTGPSQ